ncbi:MAG: hypothetical protein KJ747_03985 [Actinobacteria bacterium]|nr:hypothetical protein [Actinomycetota bacterium]MCG2807630.1 hypothetical protein [Coriobacteriia bacterium]
MKVSWTVVAEPQACGGHGVNFYAGPGWAAANLVAAVHGFDWLHFEPETVAVVIRSPDERFSAEFLATVRSGIEEYLVTRPVTVADVEVVPGVFALVNG